MGALEFFKEALIVFREHAQVLDSVFEVCYTLDAHSESEAAVDFRVNAACVKYIGVDHAAAENLYPTGAFTERAAFTTAEVAGYIHFSRRLREREVAWT